MCQSEGTHQIVMSFSPPVVGCLLNKRLTKGGGGAHGHPTIPLAMPLLDQADDVSSVSNSATQFQICKLSLWPFVFKDT